MAEVNPPQVSGGTLEIAEPLIIISIGRTYQEGQSDDETYDDVRRWWEVNPHNASQRNLVLARYQDRIVGAYRPRVWIPYSDTDPDPKLIGRHGFIGERAKFYVWQFYVGKWVPEKYRPPGAQNPVRYCDPED